MTTQKVSGGTVHALPEDVRKALLSNKAALAVWEDTTPLARSEWICWIISGKKVETRDIRIKKGLSKLSSGMRRPCCWAGCPHRLDKPMSSSQKFAYGKQFKK